MLLYFTLTSKVKKSQYSRLGFFFCILGFGDTSGSVVVIVGLAVARPDGRLAMGFAARSGMPLLVIARYN
jgi:hypothetical protein